MANKKKQKSQFDNKFRSSSISDSRIVAIRDERMVKDELPKLSFNFKDFDFNQCPPGQTLNEWEKGKLLSKLMQKFIDISAYNRVEATRLRLLKIYGSFPTNSRFKKPLYIQGDVEWATIQRIGGQKPRLAGYIIGAIFYPVFLDEEHLFYPSSK